MGIFSFFRKKTTDEETRQDFVKGIWNKYFEGSKDKLHDDASKLLETTKFNLTEDEMSGMIMRCIAIRELKGGWTEATRNALRKDCSGKLSDVDLKWLLVYCDIHYIKKDNNQEILIVCEQAGRQIGMPSPLGDISTNYQFK